MSSLNYVAHQLQELGLAAEVKGETVYCEDIDLDFDRSHDGVRGISRWLVETREEYAEVIRELHEGPTTRSEEEQRAQVSLELMETAFEEALAADLDAIPEEPWSYEEAMGHPLGEEDTVTDAQIEKAQDEAEEFAPAPPEKEHIVGSAQMTLAKELNSLKEVAQALETDDQDQGGIPSPETYIRDMKLAAEVVHSEKVEFEVSGIGYVTGEFKRRFTERDVAQNFARACVAAAKSPKYVSTIRIMTM